MDQRQDGAADSGAKERASAIDEQEHEPQVTGGAGDGGHDGGPGAQEQHREQGTCMYALIFISVIPVYVRARGRLSLTSVVFTDVSHYARSPHALSLSLTHSNFVALLTTTTAHHHRCHHRHTQDEHQEPAERARQPESEEGREPQAEPESGRHGRQQLKLYESAII